MPVVARDGEFTFIVHARELPFEPPHVHVRFGEDEVRIELDGGTFMEPAPAGRQRSIRDAFRRNARAIRSAWDRIHARGRDRRS